MHVCLNLIASMHYQIKPLTDYALSFPALIELRYYTLEFEFPWNLDA